MSYFSNTHWEILITILCLHREVKGCGQLQNITLWVGLASSPLQQGGYSSGAGSLTINSKHFIFLKMTF